MNRSPMLKPPAWYRHASPNELAKASLGTICAMGDSHKLSYLRESLRRVTVRISSFSLSGIDSLIDGASVLVLLESS